MTLPRGWAQTTLGEVADFVMGQAPPGQDCNAVGVGTPFVKAGEFGPERPIIREWTTKPLKLASVADVLICIVGATAGKINLGADCAIGRSVAAIRPSGASTAAFVHARMKLEVQKLRQGSTGTAQGVISREMLAQVATNLPPIAEQGRIVAKLNELTARIARAREHLSSVVRRAEQLREATLGDVFSQIVSDAQSTSFSDKLSLLTSGSRDWAKFYDRGSSVFVLAGNVRRLAFDPKPRRFVEPPLDGADARRSKVLKDDLLITIVGAGTGDICRVPDHYPNYFVCQSVARAVLRDTRLAAFYAYWFVSPSHGRADFEAAMYGAARPHLSFDQIQGFMVPDVSITVADEAVARIEAAFARADSLEAEAARAAALLDRLEASILAKAFRGELVPQDPADEPASALLDRVRAERAAAPQRRRRSGVAE